jgi:hypothetical protein
MPPLGEPAGLLRRSSNPSAPERSAQRRSVSPRVRGRNQEFGEETWQSDYAASYAGGVTSWLRIESQLQHIEELVELPDIEHGTTSTLVVDGRG